MSTTKVCEILYNDIVGSEMPLRSVLSTKRRWEYAKSTCYRLHCDRFAGSHTDELVSRYIGMGCCPIICRLYGVHIWCSDNPIGADTTAAETCCERTNRLRRFERGLMVVTQFLWILSLIPEYNAYDAHQVIR